MSEIVNDVLVKINSMSEDEYKEPRKNKEKEVFELGVMDDFLKKAYSYAQFLTKRVANVQLEINRIILKEEADEVSLKSERIEAENLLYQLTGEVDLVREIMFYHIKVKYSAELNEETVVNGKKYDGLGITDGYRVIAIKRNKTKLMELMDILSEEE